MDFIWVHLWAALRNQTALSWVQVIGTVAAIPVSVWVAGMPGRKQVAEAKRQRQERLQSIRRAADRVMTHRLPAAIAVLDGDVQRYDDASGKLNYSDHFQTATVLTLPVSEWPSLTLHSAMTRLTDAADRLDDSFDGASFAVMKSNSHMSRPRARQFRDAVDEFEREWNAAK